MHIPEPNAATICLDRAAKNEFLQGLIAAIRTDIKTDITMEHLAELMGMDHYDFVMELQENTRITLHDLVTAVRGKEIVKLLQRGELSDAEIATEVGLADIAQVEACLKTNLNCEISDFRQ